MIVALGLASRTACSPSPFVRQLCVENEKTRHSLVVEGKRSEGEHEKDELVDGGGRISTDG